MKALPPKKRKRKGRRRSKRKPATHQRRNNKEDADRKYNYNIQRKGGDIIKYKIDKNKNNTEGAQ